MAELTRVTTIENENWEDKASKFIYIKGQCESCGISNGQTIRKFVNFLNFDSFPSWKNSKNLLIFWILIVFQVEKILKIC